MNLAFDVTERLDEQERVNEKLALGCVVRPYSTRELANIAAMEAEVRERAGALAQRLIGRAATDEMGAADEDN